MRFLLVAVFNFFLITAFSQDRPTKVIVTVMDTVNLHTKVKDAFARTDFAVKELSTRDSIVTLPRELHRVPGYAVAIAVISGNTVTINGYYSHKKVSYFGYQKDDKEYMKIKKFKASKTWPLLEHVASRIGGEITYQ